MGNSQLPEVWPGWKTVRVIGRGSFGAVYEIERQLFSSVEKAAVKHISLPKDDSIVDSYRNDGYDREDIINVLRDHKDSIGREYELMYELRGNTNVVYCDDCRIVEKHDGIGWDIYIKMELLTPLMKTLPKSGRPDEQKVIKMAKDICNALILCESRNIVHRDIKPENIFVSDTGDYKLGDFGIAREMEHTTIGTMAGTYKYMAPEVYMNKPYGKTADIYSLGLVLYWVLNERRTPFLPLPPAIPKVSEEEKAKTRRMNGERFPDPLYGSEKLKRTIFKACAFNPSDRYQSAYEMLADLNGMAANEKAETVDPYQEESETVYGSVDGTIGKRMESQKTYQDLEVNIVAVTDVGLAVKSDYSYGIIHNSDMPANVAADGEKNMGRKALCSVIRMNEKLAVLSFIQFVDSGSNNKKTSKSTGDSWGYKDDADSFKMNYTNDLKQKVSQKKTGSIKREAVPETNRVIKFHNMELEKAVRNELYKMDRTIMNRSITINDALRLKTLIVIKNDFPIKNIDELRYFTNLEFLTLRNQEITDLSPIKGLKLNTLNVGDNKITSLDPVFSMKTLKQLVIDNCGVKAFPPISEFRQKLPGCDVVFTNYNPVLPIPEDKKIVIIPYEIDSNAVEEKRLLTLRVPMAGKCVKCSGAGHIYKSLLSKEKIICPVCNGTGVMINIHQSLQSFSEQDLNKQKYLPVGGSGRQIFAVPIVFTKTVGQEPGKPLLLAEALQQAK
ncbi:MAG: protein kinase [Erysipelotrichaceae bacterium]|nr:protein kinase [Erysipelotrichaceae bacterium]